MLKTFSVLCLLLFCVSFSYGQEKLTYNIEDAEHQLKVYNSFDAFAKHLETDSDSIVVVNFWATWCKPCVAELPYFEMLNDKYSEEKLKVILVSLDFKRQIQSKLIPFLKKNNMDSEVILLLDSKEQEWIEKVDRDWSGAIPLTLIFNKYKRLFLEQDFSDLKELEQALDNFKKLNNEK